MIGIVVVAHVPLATALAECARHVLGSELDIYAFDVIPNQCAVDCANEFAQKIRAADRGEGVLVLTDLPGASPSNIAVAASHAMQAEGLPCCVLGGVNASMLIKAINYRNGSLEDVATNALAGAKQALLRVD